MKPRALHALKNMRSPEEFAKIIRGKWQDNVSNVFDVCRWLETAKEELGGAGFVTLYRDELKWSKQMVSHLLKIAECEFLQEVHPGVLPAHWTMLYVLSRLTAEQFQEGIDTGVIHAGMERKDIKALKPSKEKPKAQPRRKPPSIPPFDRCVMEVRSLVVELLPDIPQDQWPRLIAELRAEIDDIEQKKIKEGESK